MEQRKKQSEQQRNRRLRIANAVQSLKCLLPWPDTKNEQTVVIENTVIYMNFLKEYVGKNYYKFQAEVLQSTQNVQQDSTRKLNLPSTSTEGIIPLIDLTQDNARVPSLVGGDEEEARKKCRELGIKRRQRFISAICHLKSLLPWLNSNCDHAMVLENAAKFITFLKMKHCVTFQAPLTSIEEVLQTDDNSIVYLIAPNYEKDGIVLKPKMDVEENYE